MKAAAAGLPGGTTAPPRPGRRTGLVAAAVAAQPTSADQAGECKQQ